MLKRDDALRLLYPLADAVQFSLFLCKEPKSEHYFIKGHGSFGLPVLEGLKEMNLSCKVVASAVNQRDAYIIFSVVGDLWALVTYDAAMKELNFSMLDAGSLPESKLPSVYSGKSQKALYEMLLPHLVGMWMRDERNETWSRLDEITAVDSTGESPVALLEDPHRTADPVGTS